MRFCLLLVSAFALSFLSFARVRLKSSPCPPARSAPGPWRPRIPDGPEVFGLGGGWRIEMHCVPCILHGYPGKVWRDPHGRMLVSPNRRWGWVWPPRLCHLSQIPPGVN